MRVLVATDAWYPQVNGVVRTYERLAAEAPALGFDLSFLSPPHFRTLPCPTYPEIRLALAGPRAIARHIETMRPDFIHIATEGPVGFMTRRYCRKRSVAEHTRQPGARSTISSDDSGRRFRATIPGDAFGRDFGLDLRGRVARGFAAPTAQNYTAAIAMTVRNEADANRGDRCGRGRWGIRSSVGPGRR